MSTAINTITRQAGKPYSIAELAVFLGLSERQIHRLIARGDIAIIRFSRRVMIAEQEAHRLAQEGIRQLQTAAA